MFRKIFLFVTTSLLLSSCSSQVANIHYTNPKSIIQFPESWKIYAISDEIVLLQGYLQVNEETASTLFRSRNGGADWFEVYTPPKPLEIQLPSNLLSCGGNYEFSFLDNGKGWLVSTWGAVTQGQYKLTIDTTKDFGETWSRVSEIDVAPSYELLNISFTDEKHGQINLLYTNTTNDRIAFITTTDGGITWQETGNYSLHNAFWNENKLEYYSAIENYVQQNLSKTPYETTYGYNHWKIDFQQGISELVVFKKYKDGIWAKVSSLP